MTRRRQAFERRGGSTRWVPRCIASPIRHSPETAGIASDPTCGIQDPCEDDALDRFTPAVAGKRRERGSGESIAQRRE